MKKNMITRIFLFISAGLFVLAFILVNLKISKAKAQTDIFDLIFALNESGIYGEGIVVPANNYEDYYYDPRTGILYDASGNPVSSTSIGLTGSASSSSSFSGGFLSSSNMQPRYSISTKNVNIYCQAWGCYYSYSCGGYYDVNIECCKSDFWGQYYSCNQAYDQSETNPFNDGDEPSSSCNDCTIECNFPTYMCN